MKSRAVDPAVPDPPVLTALHARFLALLPVIERHGHVCFGHLRCRHRLEEALAEMVVMAWKWFVRLVAQGKDAADFPTAIAAFAARAVRSGRRVCGQEKSKDVLSPLAQRRKGFVVQTLPAHDTGVEENIALEALRDSTKITPPDAAAFRLDFPAWIHQLGDRDRRIARDMALGERTLDLADKYGTSQARISQLRREFRADWERFTADPGVV
jgi:hypothetical protein